MNEYNLYTIRELLAAAFSASEIATLAFDLFQPVYQEFTPGMTTSQKIEMIVTHAAKREEIPRLLAYVEKGNPYRYQQFADRLRPRAVPPPPMMNELQHQRLHDLQNHMAQSLDLLRQYEDLLRTEDDPRKLLRYRREIEREKASLKRYEEEAAALGPLVASSGTANTIQQSLDALHQKVDSLSHQLGDVDRKLTGGQASIMAHLVQLDRQQQAHYLALTQRLDHNQVELVDLLLDSADKQQIAQWEAAQLTLLAQQSLVQLHHLRQNQPDSAQWQTFSALLAQDAAWEQKLKWTIPLIPGILELESEARVDVIAALREAWGRVRDRLKK